MILLILIVTDLSFWQYCKASQFVYDEYGCMQSDQYDAGMNGGKKQMTRIEKVIQFLDEVHTYYLATVEGDQPRVRPFGTALVYNGRLYIQTGKVKNVSRQLAANPKAEICAFSGGKWLRVAGELINDDDHAVKVAMLEKMPSLKGMYSAEDDNMQVLYFRNAQATFSSFTEAPETFSI